MAISTDNFLRASLALLFFLVATAFAAGQIAKPLPMGPATVDTSGGRLMNRNDGVKFGAELTGGLNAPIRRVQRLGNTDWDGLSIKPGFFVGVNGTLTDDGKTFILLGVEYLLERGALLNYSPPSNRASNGITRSGDIAFNEHQIRFALQVRFTAGPIKFNLGGHLSRMARSTYRFEYDQITRFRTNFDTGEVTPLDEPIIFRGEVTREFTDAGYLGLLFGLGYQVSERALVRARIDWGLHTSLSSDRFDRHSRDRMDVGVDYLLFPR